jgi:CHAT domain-containing protein/tetratricopeptide (TPR) repeat protein
MSMRDRVAIYRRKPSRSRALHIVCIAWLGCLAACSGGHQDPVTEFTTELTLLDDKAPEVKRLLEPGVYLVELRERAIDVRTTIDIAGKQSELLDRTPRHGVMYKVVSLRSPAELRVRVNSVDHASKKGHADLRLARWRRAPDAPASERELGYIAYSAAGEQNVLATPESWALAAEKLNESINHFEAAGDDAARGLVAYTLANLQYAARDEFAAAIRATEIAADAFAQTHDVVGEHNAAALRAAAELDLAAGMDAGTQRAEQSALNDAADRRLKDAAEFFSEQQLPLRAAYAVNMRGIRALNLGDDDAAAGFFSQAVKMARANEDTAEEAKALANLAWVHRLNGLVAQAADEYASLLPIIDPERQAYMYAVLLNNYGHCLIVLGEFDRALKLHTEALELFTKTGKEAERGTELAALGGLYFRVGDAERAIETLRAAIVAHERVSDTRALASTLRVAGNVASTLGQHDMALEHLRRSVKIDANPHNVARTRVLVAAELRVIGELNGAEAELREAIASPNALVRADALAERARLSLAQRNPKSAMADLRAADRAYGELGLEFNRIDINSSLAQLLLAAGDLPGAAAAAEEGVSLVRRIRVNSANPEWRARFLSAQYAPFEAQVAVDLASGPLGDENAAWKGFRTADGIRARSLADQMEHEARAERARADPEADTLRARLTSQQLRLEGRLQRSDADDAGTREIRRDIEETRARLYAHGIQQPAVVSQEATLPGSVHQAQTLLPPDTVVLAYFVGDVASHAWLLDKKGVRHATLEGRERLQRAIDAAASASPNSADARQLGSLLFGKLLEGATGKRMLVIPDGPLNAVPFAALPIPGSGRDLLLDRFVIGYAPSFALALQTTAGRQNLGKRVAVISDPVYAPDDRRLPAVGKGGNFRGPRKPSSNKLTRLPYSALEARAVVNAIGAKDTIELNGFDATPQRVLALPAKDLAVLHFATHALARKDAPERSALFLSEYSPDGALLPESRLTASDIMRSGLHARVVVLSGCATGDGSALRGEGVLGLTYGFLANGSRAVIASLWPVEDASTARFMNEFYRAYGTSGRAADALRSAQLRTRGSATTAVWSSFVVRANGFP